MICVYCNKDFILKVLFDSEYSSIHTCPHCGGENVP